MNYHPIIDLLKRIVIALPDYAGGGGLPDVITSIDGGEFIPVSDTQCSAYVIYHTLDTIPIHMSVWTTDNDLHTSLDPVSERYLFNSAYIHDEYIANSSTTYNGTPIYIFRSTNGNASSSGTPFYSSTNPSTTTFSLPALFIYKAGITYKWIAFA